MRYVHVDRFPAKSVLLLRRLTDTSCNRSYNTIGELRAQARIHLITRIAYH